MPYLQRAAIVLGLVGAFFVAMVVSTYFARDERVIEPASQEAKLTTSRLANLVTYCLDFKKRTKAWPNSPATLGMFFAITQDKLIDGWGRAFVFYTNIDGSLSLVSYGADGQAGGKGTNADLCMEVK